MQIRGSKAGGALRLSSPCKSSVVIPGSPSARRPATAGPHPWPKAEHRAVASSFFSFERDPHDLNPQHSISKS